MGNPYEELAVAVIFHALAEEGLGYLETDDGQWWSDVAGINPSAVTRQYWDTIVALCEPATT